MRLRALLLVLLYVPAVRAEMALVENNNTKVVIHVSPAVMAPDNKDAKLKGPALEAENQRRRLRESVKDLSYFLEKMAGARFLIRQEPPKDGPAILIGDYATAAFGPVQKKAPYKQGFRLVVKGQQLGFLGESDLATSYAIYELLDRLGCRWYIPGELGEVVPEHTTINLAEEDFNSAPGTIYRGVWYADDAFRRRNRHGGLLLSAGHALEMYLTKEDRKAHPEWQAIVGGKPHPTRLKWSNPAVAAAIADKILAQHQNAPADSWSISPDDGIDFDESKEDTALDAGDFDSTFQGTAITDRLMVLCNRIAERTSAKHPDMLLGMLAYAQYVRPPVREKVHPGIVPQIAPITYSRAHPVTDDAVPGNKDLRYLIEGWGKKARMTSMYFYAYYLAEPSAPNPLIGKWSVDVPFVLRNNCQFWQPETLSTFEVSMHGLYLGCRLAWNPKLKPADIIDDINSKFYGSAAKEMAAYWSHIDDIWTKTPEYSGCGFGYLRRFTPEKMTQARKLLNQGLARCQTPAEKKRVTLAEESLGLFELFMKLRGDLAEGRWTGLETDGNAWIKKVDELGKKYENNFAFTRTTWRPTTVSGNYFEAFYHLTYKDASKITAEKTLLTKPLRTFRYQADPDKKGEAAGFGGEKFDDSSWKTTDVCMETWSTLGKHDYFKSMWYRTQIELPEIAKGKKVYLWLGATDGSAKVFVNGRHIPFVDPKKPGKDFEGYCQPVSFEITSALNAKGPATIAVLCTRTFFNELGTGGLIGPAVVYREK